MRQTELLGRRLRGKSAVWHRWASRLTRRSATDAEVALNRRKLKGFAIPGGRLVRTFGGGARPRRAD
jgi:hypothetical protein